MMGMMVFYPGMPEQESPPYEDITIEEFNALCRQQAFEDGPQICSFGEGYGEPYHPHRRVWGILKDGRKVQSET